MLRKRTIHVVFIYFKKHLTIILRKPRYKDISLDIYILDESYRRNQALHWKLTKAIGCSGNKPPLMMLRKGRSHSLRGRGKWPPRIIERADSALRQCHRDGALCHTTQSPRSWHRAGFSNEKKTPHFQASISHAQTPQNASLAPRTSY